MNIGFNDTRWFAAGNLLAGFGNVVGALGVSGVGFGAALLTQRLVHKIAVDYFNVENTSENLENFELACGGLVGLGVSVSLACYCPFFNATIGKVAKLAVMTGIIGGINYYLTGGEIEHMAGVSIVPIVATLGAVLGLVGRPGYAIAGLVGTVAGAIYGVNNKA